MNPHLKKVSLPADADVYFRDGAVSLYLSFLKQERTLLAALLYWHLSQPCMHICHMPTCMYAYLHDCHYSINFSFADMGTAGQGSQKKPHTFVSSPLGSNNFFAMVPMKSGTHRISVRALTNEIIAT